MKSNFRVWFIALLGMMVFGVADAYASSGTSYSRARAFLKEGSPTAGGKVYVSTSSSTPAASSYKNCTSSTSAASSAQVEGASKSTTYHFWATANAGYKFTGWYSKNASGVYTLASSNAHYSVSVTSGAAPSSGTEYTDKDLYAEFLKLIQLSFITPTNGSYTITHNGAAVADYASFTVNGPVKLTATPAAGYKLRGWYYSTDGGTTKSYFAFGNTCEPNFTDNKTIGADFVLDDGKATFWPKGSTKVFEDLNAAVAATSSGGIIVVVSDGTLAKGDYTINKSITLLLPYSTTNAKMTEPNVVHVTAAGSAPTLSVYRKLSLAPGANITVASGASICLGGSIASVNGGNNSSFPCGPSGVLDLSQGGEVTLNSGAVLYAWGFVQGQNMDQGNNTSGVGHITAKSGSTVWEDYQVGDWRGGTASSSIYSSRSSWKFFPFQSWTIQNIEAPITYEYGATGKCFWTIFGDGSVHSVKFDYVASSSSLFTLSAEGATLDKWYDPTTDKVVYQVDGTTKVDAITLSVLGYTITTSEYNLPVPCNMSIVLKGGTFTAANSIVMHAGSSMEVKAGASFALNTNLYLFDQSEWGKYCMYYGGSDVYFQMFNTLTKHYDRGDRTSKAGLEDATLVVDGTIVVNSSKGKLYSTASGSKIVGNGGGVIRFAGSLPSSTSITMCTNLKNTSSVSIANANLLNENGTYTKCKGSSYFDNVNGRWFIRSAKNAKADHTWDFTYISSGAKTGTGGTDAVVSAVYSNDKTGDEDRMIWANVDDDSCDDWWKGLDAGQTSYYYHYQSKAWHQFIPVSGMSGHYSGSDGKLYQKSGCDWTEPSIPYEDCLYTIDAVQKALVDGAFVQVVPNDPDDHAWHKSGAASTYYICLPGCVWKAATRIAGYSQAYTTTRDSKQYIWYEDKWLEATEDAPFFCARIDNKKKYFEFVDGAWTLMDPLAEVTISGETTEYVRFSDVMEAINDATANPTVRLLKNINLTSGVTYSNNKQVTFNLNGFTLSGEVNELITINNASAIFIVIDGSTGGTGKIDMTFAKSDARSTAINITSGHLMLNSGTIHAENTSDAQSTCAIELANGTKFTQNGGTVEASSLKDTWGIHMSGTTAEVKINNGIDSVYSSANAVRAYALYSVGGTMTIAGGRLVAYMPSNTSSSGGASAVYINGSTCRLTVNGGVLRGIGQNYTRTLCVDATSAAATINGGSIEAECTSGNAYALRMNGKITVNEGATIRSTAPSSAIGAYSGNSKARLWVNGGKFYVKTTSSGTAYGVEVNTGTDTINGGEFYITSKTKNAYGVYADLKKANRFIVVNDGKFMLKSQGTDSTEFAYCCNAAGQIGGDSLLIRGGYWNINTNLSGYIGTKVVKGLDETLEADLIAAGYKYKVRGAERTVTWKNRNGVATLATTLVEDGKLPVYPGVNPTFTAGDDNYVFKGWAYSKNQNKGTTLTAVTRDTTIYAAYTNMQAELIANGKTTLYEWANSALTAAEGYEQATVRLLAYCGDNVRVHDYVPSVANAITTLDLNGHTWVCLTVQNDEDYFIKVNKSDAKLIITDNSEGKTGKLSYRRNRPGHIYGYRVASGELVLQAGTLECINTNASGHNAVGVVVSGASAKLTMTGGTIEVAKTAASTGGATSGIYAYGPTDIVGGRIYSHHDKGSAYGIQTFSGTTGVVNIGGDVTVDVEANNSAKGIYGYGTAHVDSCAFNVSTTSGGTAIAFQPCKGSGGNGSLTIDGNPTVNVTSATSEAYGVRVSSVTQWVSAEDTRHPYDADGITATVNGGTFTVTSGTTNASAIFNHNGGEVTINGGTFNTKTSGGTCSVLEANHGSTTTINDGTFTVGTTTSGSNWWNVQGFHVYEDSGTTLVNIHGGKFTVTNSSAANSAYFIRAFAGTINLIGDSIKASANNLIYNHNEYIYNDTCFITIDGGEYTTVSTGIDAQRRVKADDATKASDMEVTILDGKFKSTSGEICNTNTTIMPVKNLKLLGGYFSKKSMSKASFDNYVVAPSTSEELTSGSEFDAGYTYHVINKHAITWDWNDGKTASRTDQVLHNAMPNFGGIPTHTGTDTYEFLGWNTKADGSGDTVTISKADTTYYARWRKLEAEVYEGDSEEPIRYEKFTDAFNAAQNMHVARVKVLSDVKETTLWTLSPDSVGGSQPLTLDLNNHSVTCSKATTNTYALTINKEGCKLIIDDTSEQKEGSFIHSRSSKAEGYKIHGVHLQNGELELAGGTLWAMNNDTTVTSGDGAYAVVAESGTVFTQTGGKLLARCPLDPRAYYTSGSGVFNITGGTIEVTTQYKKKSGTYYGTAAYGVYLNNYGTFNMSGTATMSVKTGTGAYGVYVYGGGGSGYPVANMSGGSITCMTITGQASRAIQVHGTHASANISGGNLTANSSEDSERWNVEDVACTGGADVTITGGNFHSTTGANCVGVRVFNGTATIGGDAYFDSRHGVVVGDWAEVDGTTATATINGGTFNCPEYVLYANETSHDAKTVTGTMYVNGGYFKTASGKICGSTSGVGRLVLNGGYYNETSSTTQKTNITTYKGGSATVQDLASTDPAYSDGYRYHISTPYTVTWVYGDVSESETVDCGVMPSKDLTTYTYGGKIYYVTGWSPALSVVTGNITYTAVSAAYEAAVTVDETTTRYTSFSDAWAYALTQEEATITLLNNVDLSEQKTYAPTVDSARHTLDLNNFTIAYSGTGSWAIKVNRADAQLTITDNSVGAGGKLQKHVDRDGTSYAIAISSGDLVISGGEISVRNSTTNKAAYGVNVSAGGTFTMTGGTLRACSYAARAINTSAACTINISGGHIIATSELTEDTWLNYAYGVYSSGAGTITISGSPIIDADANRYAYGIIAGSGSSTNATINGGTVNATTHGSYNAFGVYAQSSSVMTINGGVFNATSSTTSATGVRVTGTASMTINGGTFNAVAGGTSTCFGAYTSSTEPFYITGGTFNVNHVDNATSADYFDVVRVQPGANAFISGGSFNTGAKKGYGVSAWGGTTTISGNPTFTARIGVIAGYKCEDTGSDTCTATVVINGGTFNVSSYAVYAAWDTSDPAKGSNLVNSDITINGGHFKNTGDKIVFEEADGTGTATLTINGGYFNEKSGTTYKTQVNKYVTSPYEVYDIESYDPNYPDYSYRVTEHPVASVKTGSEITYYTTAKAALDYAKTVANPTITLLDDCDFETEAQWGYSLCPAGKTMTIDLNNHTLNATNTVASYDRVFGVSGQLTITDNSESKGGKLSLTKNHDGTFIGIVVDSSGKLTLADGIIYVENEHTTKGVCAINIWGTSANFTQTGGLVEAKSNGGANGLTHRGSVTLSGGEIRVTSANSSATGDAPSADTAHELYGSTTVSGTASINVTAKNDARAFTCTVAGTTTTINGGTFKATATNGTSARCIHANVANTITVSGGKFFAGGDKIVDVTSATLTITGGYFNEKSGTTYKSQINSYVSSPYEIYEISSADPNYPEYSYCVTNGHPVASVQTGDEMSHYTTVLAAMNYARTVEDPTITILDDASLTARWSINTTPDNWHGILDLNGHTVTGAGSDYEMITVGKAGIKLTIRDSSVGQTGKITHEESTRNKVWGVNVSQGELELESGTIYVKNSKAGVDAVGVCTNINEDAVLTMKGGKVETHSAINAKALYLYGGSATISGGKVIAITELNGTIGATAYGIYMDKPSDAPAPSLTVSGADSIYAKAGTATNERAYTLYAYKGTATIEGTPYFIAESPAGGARVLQSSSTGSVTVNGGTFEAKTTTSDSYALIAEGSSTMTANGGKFKTNQNNITYHNSGAGATLTINGGYFNEYTTGTNHKTTVDARKGSGKAVIDLDTDDAEYIAGYRYIVTDDPVAKVKVGSSVTYHPTVASAFTAANSATAASTIKLLKAATVTTQLTYDNENDQNCTLDLNGFTLTSTTNVQSPLTINNADITFTVTDGTVGKAGKLSMTTDYSSGDIYSVLINAGALVLDGGTIEVTANRQTNGIWVKTGASFTMHDGTFHVKTINSKKGRGVFIDGGMATIDGGEIFMETAGNGTAIFYNSGTGAVTVTGGKFKIITTATEYVTYGDNKNISISGGYYNYSNDRLTRYLATSYHVFNVDPALDGIYTYEVAEGYTLAWTTDGDDLTGDYTTGTTKVGATITAPNTPTKTGYTFAGWSTTPAATMPASDVTYTATWTINSFDVTFNMQGHGAAIAKQTIDYNGLVAEPAAPTEANYVFGGWYKEDGCTNAWNFATDHVTAATTLYAKWTDAVASVTVGGATTYYDDFADAWEAANLATGTVTLKLLQNVEGIASSLTYTNAQNCTLDLNNHTLSGSESKLIDINATGKTFTIDDSSAEKEGKISMITSENARVYGLFITAGTVNLKHGTIYSQNTHVYSSAAANKNSAATAVYVTAGQTFTMDDGTVESEAQHASYAILADKAGTTTITINDGLVKGHTNKSTTAAGIYTYAKGLTVNNGRIVGHAYTTTAYGIYLYGGSATLNGGTIEATNDTTNSAGTTTTYGVYVRYSSSSYKGVLTVPATSTVNVLAKSRTTTACAVYVYASSTASTIAAGTFTAIAKTSSTAQGINSAGTITVSGGTFNVSAATTSSTITTWPCGIYATRGTVTVNGNPTFNVTSGASRAFGVFAYGTVGAKGTGKYSGTIKINGGTFNVTTTTTTAYGAYAGLLGKNIVQKTENAGDTIFGQHYMPGIIRITNGTFNVTATTKTAYGVVVAAAESESGFEGATKKIPTLAITGGKFKVVSTGDATKAYAVNTSASNTALDIQGGYYNIDTNLSGYVATTKSCNYYCLETTAADKAEVGSDYEYKVAEAYTLTWNLNGGTVTTAGTGAPVDATGTPNIVWGVGDAITAPTVTKTGYTFASWSPEVAATMPAENTTYTAVWAEAVASVTINGNTKYYATFTGDGSAWSAANSAGYASTIKLLKNVEVASQLEYNNSNTMNCTLDLNGHTITSTTAVQSPLSINCSGSTFTITDNTDSKLGELSMTTSYEAGSGVIFGAYVGAGTLQLDGGTLEVIVSSGTRHTCGVSVVSSFIMNGGTIHVNNTNGSDGRGVYSAGTVTINNGTIHVEAAGDGYAMKRDGGTITVNGGKFNINGSNAYVNYASAADANLVINGGYYTTNQRLGTFVPSPYHVFDLAGQSPYLYEVAEGYNLTWDLDGGAISVAGTPAGYVKVGTAVTAPTVTKTGYDFNAWSPAVVSPMPAANTTYTATWTPTTYTLSYDLDGGTVASENPTSYTIESSAITLNNPTKANHVFTGWTGTGLASATITVTISAGSIGNRSYTATWTEAEASVTDGGATTYYTTVAAAVAAANATSGATVKMLKNASTNEVEIKAAMTIDLNGKTVSSTQATSNTGVFKMNASGKTLTIRDSGTGGMIDHTATISGGALVGIYVYAGSLRMESGIIYAKNPSTTNSSKAFGIVTTNSSCGLTMTGGTVTAEAYKEARGLWLNGTTSLTNATITSTSTNDLSYAVQANAGALTVHSGTYTATGTPGYAVRELAGTVSIEGGKFSGSTQDFYKEGGTASISGGYYVHDTDIQNYCADNYYVVSTTEEVGYNYKVAEVANTGFYADIVDVDNTNSKLILNVTGWASGGWPYTINGVSYYKDAASAAAAGSDLCREADRTLKVPYTGAPGDNFAMQIKKASGDEISNRIYVIPQEITSNTTISANPAMNLYVKGATLTVNGSSFSAKNIYVAPDAALVINSGKTLTADSIFLRTTASSSAQMENKGTIAGSTKVVYTRIIKDKDFHFFGLPLNCAISAVKLSDGVVPQYGSGWLLRSYNEARRAVSGADDNNWVSVAAGATISGGKGYEMYSASNYYREFYFPVDLSGLTTSVPLEFSGIGAAGESNAGWNALVSPLTHTYENEKVPEGLVVGWYRDGWYEQEIPEEIPAATAFVFQTNKAGYLSFEGSSIVAALPRRATDEETRIQWLNVDLEDADGVGDQTSIYAHPTRYEQSYKAGIDVAKQSFEASRAILYSSHAYGEMAFAGVADSVLENGVALTIYSPKEQELTFSMRENEWLNRMEYVWLIDHETGAATDLLYDTYTFSSPAGTTRGRFTIQGVFKAPQITTGIDSGDGVKAEAEKARKVLIDQKMYILLDGAMYDATGKRVNK